MSRNLLRNNRGRPSLQGSPRLLKTKDTLDQTYNESPSRKNKGSKTISKYARTVQQNKRRRRATTPSSASSSSEGFDADDASDEQSESDDDDEGDDEDDSPAVFAPSQQSLLVGPGLDLDIGLFDRGRAVSVESMFGLHVSDVDDDDNEPIANYDPAFFVTSDDDEIYEAVNDVSDSDDNDVEQYEQQQMMAAFSEDEIEEVDFLNHIDGMSAYGFGSDSDDATAIYPASIAGDSPNDTMERHVRFQVDEPAFRQKLSESPTFSRSLLPSALPELGSFFSNTTQEAATTEADDYDSDATDEYLPPIEDRINAEQESEVKTEPDTQAPQTTADGAPNGPKWGVFIDNGEKPSGILDPTGKIVIIAHPHLLGDEFVRRYNDSATSSPGDAFDDLLDGSDVADSDITPLADASELLGNLPHIRRANSDSANAGPAYQFSDDGTDLDENLIRIDDVIKFDDDDASDSDATPLASPMFITPRTPASARQQRHLFSLSSSNVTAFRRSADPNYSTMRSTTPLQRMVDLASSPLGPSGGRKRKNTNESPYASAHYEGVTPVQRMSEHEHAQSQNVSLMPSTPDTVRVPKRQRMMTTA